MKIKTAVEILEISLLGIVSFDSEVLRNKYKEKFKIAKEIEKEQHEMAFNEALDENSNRWFEKYYNETFKKETK
jgi:septum formation inhibitor-activating ATPase MinD